MNAPEKNFWPLALENVAKTLTRLIGNVGLMCCVIAPFYLVEGPYGLEFLKALGSYGIFLAGVSLLMGAPIRVWVYK